MLKFRQNCRLTEYKRSILSRSQYFTDGEHLNSDYFLYKLNLLEGYLTEVRRSEAHKLTKWFVKICLIALLKHVQANHKDLLKVMLKQPILADIDANKITILVELGELHKKMEESQKKSLGAYGNFALPGEVVVPKADE